MDRCPVSGLALGLILSATLTAAEPTISWSGDYAPCRANSSLLKREGIKLGVRFSTMNPVVAIEFAHALDFWAKVIDMEWHREDTTGCSIQVVDGYPHLFQPAVAARAQLPGTASYQGWIAFNPKLRMPPDELFLTAVHELGHMLGLPHSSNPSSVMYFLNVDGAVFLDEADLALLSTHYRLRASASRLKLR
jgi:hypothetical protein